MIKRAYHKAVLLYHPDKKQNASTDIEQDRIVFLKIQEAFNTLSTESKRRAYDSQLDFDDSIPTDKEIEKALKKGGVNGFCALFDPVFKRNARFAEVRPVPDIGDENTPMDQVYRFYDYWIKFDSWRDFSTVGMEHNPDNAGCREEKRWMVKENERVAKKLKKKEMARVTNLVMKAMEKDPRVVADKLDQKQKKEAAKEAKEEESRKRAEEEIAAKKWADEQEAAAAEAAKANKENKEKLKKLQSRYRNALRKLLRMVAEINQSTSEYGVFSEADVEFLFNHVDLNQLQTLTTALGGEAAVKSPELLQSSGIEDVTLVLQSVREAQVLLEEEERKEREAQRGAGTGNHVGEKMKKGVEREWSRDDLSVLSRGLTKYPAGTRQRWVSIANHMNTMLKPMYLFEPEECMRAAHHAMQSVASGGKPVVSNGLPTPPTAGPTVGTCAHVQYAPSY